MPRRGELTRSFPAPVPRQAEVDRIGLRQVVVRRSNGTTLTIRLDPSTFDCQRLAVELADEWAEMITAAGLGEHSARMYRQAVTEFCAYVDATVSDAGGAALGCSDPDLHRAVTEWIRLLPSRHAPGSRTPACLAGRLRALIARRIAHPSRPVDARLNGWVEGALGLRRGQNDEIDEFTRADKKRLIQAAWADHLAIENRLRQGWKAAASGIDPSVGGWDVPENLLWAIANDADGCANIIRHLPDRKLLPPRLRELVGAPRHDRRGRDRDRRALLRCLVNQLFLSNLDLHAYRILLMAATGRTPEEVAALDEDDIEFGPHSVTISFTKRRANSRSRQAFSTAPPEATAVLHPSEPKLDAGEIARRLLELSRPLAKLAGISPVPLFLRAAVDGTSSLTARHFDRLTGSTLRDWIRIKGLTIDGAPDIRRLRKSTKVEKAIAFKGRISDIADDHSVQTFQRHYAHGTTLKVIAGHIITAAQQQWFRQALDGPIVLSDEAEQSLADSGSAAALGLTPDDIEQLRAGQLDMGLSSCRDPFDSPYGRPGRLCPVAPTRCLECRHALVLPSNLPQLLLFADHLNRLQVRLSPQHFHSLWGQSRVNVIEAIRARTDIEIAVARQQIASEGLALQLPLAAKVEFDT